MAVTIDGDSAFAAITHQDADGGGAAEPLHASPKIAWLAPGEGRHRDDGLERGGFVFHTEIAGEKSVLIGVDGLHGAFPGNNLFVENAADIRHGMKMQVATNVTIFQA